MSNGNVVYDYAVIEQCNAMISQKVQGMEATAQQFQGDVARLVAQTWGGQAANEYENAAGMIRTDLEDRKNTLLNLGRSLQTSSDEMQATDKKGGQTISSSI